MHNHLAVAYEANDEPDKALAESRAVIGYYEQLAKAAASRGIEMGEPTWLEEARERVARLESAAS